MHPTAQNIAVIGSPNIRRAVALALPLAMALAGCKKEPDIRVYDAPKTPGSGAVADSAAAPSMPSAPQPAPAAMADPNSVADLHWTLPPGWTAAQVPSGGMFQPDAAISVSSANPNLLLTVSHLGDAPGARSIPENVGRWAGQLGLPPLSDDDLKRLVTPAQIGDVTVSVADLSNNGRRLLGAIVPHDQSTWFLKLSGAADAVGEQKQAYDAFVKSIRFDSAGSAATTPPAAAPSGAMPTGALPPGHVPIDSMPMPPAAGPSAGPAPEAASLANGVAGVAWTLPAHWSAAPGGSFRLATIKPGNAGGEIRVSKFAGLGGGSGANVSRWRGEVGLDAVDDAHADAGQSVTLGGHPWIVHDYSGPADGGKRAVIAIGQFGEETWFFKFVGPTDAVTKAKGDFDAFLGSVHPNP